MPRLKTGSAIAKKKIRGSKTLKVWFARVTYFDDEGKRREWTRKPKDNTKTAAKEEAKRMLQELEGQGQEAIDAANMTFAQLAEFYQETYLIDAGATGSFRCKSQDMVSQKAVSEHKPTVRWLLLTFVGSIEDAPAVKTVAQPLTLLWLPG